MNMLEVELETIITFNTQIYEHLSVGNVNTVATLAKAKLDYINSLPGDKDFWAKAEQYTKGVRDDEEHEDEA
jgi:hypothetical protein